MSFNLKTYYCFIALTFAMCLVSCANRGAGPTGGPKDVTPPELLRSIPDIHQINVSSRHIDLYFDEIVQLTNPTEKVVISPAQLEPATIKAIGKRVSVILNDSLKANTTYTIDFGESISDNNEKNILKNFAVSFSTGASIDTMQIAGTVLDAHTLDPVPNVLTGIHSNLKDSAFTHFPLLRVGKTEEKGRFVIRGIKNGDYRVYALNDMNSNFYFDQPAEGIAAYETPVHTSSKMDTRNDTIRTDSAKIDTIKHIPYVRYLPDSLVLRYYKEQFFRQRFIKSERLEKDKFTLYFNAPNDTLPILKPLNFKWKQQPLVQRSIKSDTLSFWIRDTIAAKMDTLKMALYYHKSDSVGRLIPALDTLNLRFRNFAKMPKAPISSKSTKKPKESVKPVVETLKINTDILQDMDVYKSIRIKFDVPIKQIDTTKIHLYQRVDTLWKTLPVSIKPSDEIGLSYMVHYKWKPEEQYKFAIDSAMYVNLRGLYNEKYSQTFKVRALEDYSSLKINLIPLPEHAVFELLDKNDAVLRTLKVTPTQNMFEYLLPGEYYLRLYIDSNDNGKWDTGNFKQKRQPEQVYYFPLMIKLRANFDIEEDWNPTAIPLDKQKPKELIKKPDQNSSSGSHLSR